MIRRVSLVSLTHDLLDNAATLPPGGLSTTAAIHLASALTIKRDLTAFVCYDKQLSDAAEAAGLPVAAPPSGAPGPPDRNCPGGPRVNPAMPAWPTRALDARLWATRLHRVRAGGPRGCLGAG